MGGITTIRVSRDVRDRLKEYAEPRGLNLGAAVALLLEAADAAEHLARIESLLREQNSLLAKMLDALEALRRAPLTTAVETAPPPRVTGAGEELPSFVHGNPWVEVLARRGSR